MARVRVGDEDVHALFRPGGSVEDIDRTDRSGRSRFNLETGLQFANQAMRSPALGVGANLLGRGLTALGRSIRQDGTTDMSALRQQAAARLAGAAPDMAAGRMAIGAARTEQAGRDAQAQQRPLSLGDVTQTGEAPRSSSNLATQNPYEFSSSPNRQYLPEGAVPFSTQLEGRVADAERDNRLPERPALPQIDYDRPFFSEEDMTRHKELRKHLTTASSPAEAIRIAQEMHAHQDRMAGRPNMVGEARNAVSNWAKQYVQNRSAAPAGMDSGLEARKVEVEQQLDAMYRQGGRLNPAQMQQFNDLREELNAINQDSATTPAAPAPKVVMAHTPAGPVPVVNNGDGTLTMRDQETGGLLHVEIGADGRPKIKQRFSAEEAMQLAQQQRPAAAAPQMTQQTERERAAEMLRSGARAPQQVAEEATPALDEFGRTPEKAAEAKWRAAELVQAPTAPRGPMGRDELLAMATMARTPQEQADVLRQVKDVDVWGTTLEDILTGSHQAKGQFLRQLHEVMPQQHSAPLKSVQELKHIEAQTATERSKAKWYNSKPEDMAANTDLKRQLAAERMSHDLEAEHAAEHRISATRERNQTQERLGLLKNDATLAALANRTEELKQKIASGFFKKSAGVQIHIGDKVKVANSLREAGEDAFKHIETAEKDAAKVDLNDGHYGRMSAEDFNNTYPGKPADPRPTLPTKPTPDPKDIRDWDDVMEEWRKESKDAREQQDRWDAKAEKMAAARQAAFDKRESALTAKAVLADPELKKKKGEAKSLWDQGAAAVQSLLPKPKEKK